MVRGDNLKALYTTFQDIYFSATRLTWRWESGDKGRVKTMFTFVAEAMGLRNEKDFRAVLKVFTKYVELKTSEWLKWKKKSRSNYLGFMEKRGEIELYVKGLEEGTKSSAEDLNIAGTSGEDAWSF